MQYNQQGVQSNIGDIDLWVGMKVMIATSNHHTFSAFCIEEEAEAL